VERGYVGDKGKLFKDYLVNEGTHLFRKEKNFPGGE